VGNNRIFALVAAFMVQVIYGLTFTFANDVIDDGHIKPFGFILLRIIGAASFKGINSKHLSIYPTCYSSSIRYNHGKRYY